MKRKLIMQLGLGAMAAMMAAASVGATFEKLNPKTSIRYIENYGTYAVVHYNKAVDNTLACDPVDDVAYPDPKGDPTKIQAAVINYTTAEGKAMFVQILASAAARKKTHLVVTTCDTGDVNNTGLPIIDSVETRF